MADDLSLFVPITKIEKNTDGSRTVHGILSDSTLDLDGQRVDWNWFKKAAPDWFAEYGNVRYMHQNDVIGKGTDLKLDDATEVAHLTSKVVDPIAILKLDEDMLKGYSIGVKNGGVIKAKDAPNGRIVKGRMVEASLVDHPANINCKITIAKAVGAGPMEVLEEQEVFVKAVSGPPEGQVVVDAPPLDVEANPLGLPATDIIKTPIQEHGNPNTGIRPTDLNTDNSAGAEVVESKPSAEAGHDPAVPGKNEPGPPISAGDPTASKPSSEAAHDPAVPGKNDSQPSHEATHDPAVPGKNEHSNATPPSNDPAICNCCADCGPDCPGDCCDTCTIGATKAAEADPESSKIVRKQSDGYHVYSEDGSKHLGGPYPDKTAAAKRIAQIEGHKNKTATADDTKATHVVHKETTKHTEWHEDGDGGEQEAPPPKKGEKASTKVVEFTPSMYAGDGFHYALTTDTIEKLVAVDVAKRDFSAKERKQAADSGAAMSDGSFPIHTEEDLHNAIRLAGNAKNPDKAKAHIKARASSMGMSAAIPDTWKSIGADDPSDEGEIQKGGRDDESQSIKLGNILQAMIRALMINELQEDEDEPYNIRQLSGIYSELCNFVDSEQWDHDRFVQSGGEVMSKAVEAGILVERAIGKIEKKSYKNPYSALAHQGTLEQVQRMLNAVIRGVANRTPAEASNDAVTERRRELSTATQSGSSESVNTEASQLPLRDRLGPDPTFNTPKAAQVDSTKSVQSNDATTEDGEAPSEEIGVIEMLADIRKAVMPESIKAIVLEATETLEKRVREIEERPAEAAPVRGPVRFGGSQAAVESFAKSVLQNAEDYVNHPNPVVAAAATEIVMKSASSNGSR